MASIQIRQIGEHWETGTWFCDPETGEVIFNKAQEHDSYTDAFAAAKQWEEEYAMLQDSSAMYEKKGIPSLTNLIERNMSEYGSGAGAVKELLWSLYTGNAGSFNLTSMRVLDEENFDDAINVIRMCCSFMPRCSIAEYIENGNEIFKQIGKELGEV